MQSIPSINRIDHHHFRDFINKYMNNNTKNIVNNNNNNNVSGDKVSDDNFLKYCVYEENSDYKKSIIIASVADAQNLNNESIRRLEIYRDRFGDGSKMVFSQKVYDNHRHVTLMKKILNQKKSFVNSYIQ